MGTVGEWAQASWWAGAALAVLGLVVVALALFRDRSRGRRRCPRCWYDMSGVVGMTCPECGKSQKKERRFFKTRRGRWQALMGAMVLVLAAATALAPAIPSGAWIGYAPTPLLRLLASFFQKDTDHAMAKVERQLSVSTLTPWERVLVASDFGRALVTRTDDDASVRERQAVAFFFLNQLGSDSRVALPDLATCLEQDWLTPLVAETHIKLGELAHSNGPALARALRRSNDSQTRKNLIEAIYAVGGRDRVTAQEMRERIGFATATDSERLEDLAVWIMLDADDPGIVAGLGKIVGSGNPEYRVMAIRMLGLLAHSREASYVRLENQMVYAALLFSPTRPRQFPTERPSAAALRIIKKAKESNDPEVRRQTEDVLKGIKAE